MRHSHRMDRVPLCSHREQTRLSYSPPLLRGQGTNPPIMCQYNQQLVPVVEHSSSDPRTVGRRGLGYNSRLPLPGITVCMYEGVCVSVRRVRVCECECIIVSP